MKKIPTLVLLAITAGPAAQAQWTTDVSLNTTVRAVNTGEAAVPLIAEGPEGSTYTSWFENGSGSYQLRMQRLDVDGNRLWPDDGLLISGHPQNSAIFRYDLKHDADGNAVVAFQDERTGQLDIVAYKIGPDGSFLWGPDGVELPTAGHTGLAPTVSPLSNGNTVISWNTDAAPRTVAVQLVGPSGEVLLAQPMLVSASVNVSNLMPVATSDGGFLLLYGVSAGGFGLPPWLLHAQRYDAAGAPQWNEPVQVSSRSIPFFHFPHPLPDGHDGLYLAFNTGNPANPAMTDVYVQRLRGNGSLWSAEGVQADAGSSTHKFVAGKGLAPISDIHGVMVPLQVTDGSQNESGVFVQRLDTSGAVLLGSMAVELTPISAAYTAPVDIAATGDGAVIVQSTGGFGQQQLSAVRVDLAGLAAWSPSPLDLSTVNSNKGDVAVTGVRDAQAVVVWQDDRSPMGIYAQPIHDLDVGTGVAETHTAHASLRLESNPAERPVLLLSERMPGAGEVQVFDGVGRLAYTGKLPSTTRVELPLAHLPAGLYTVRATAAGQAWTVRWMK